MHNDTRHLLQPPVLSVAALRSAFDGPVVTPGDEDYDEARSLFYGGFDRRPEAILRPEAAADVSRAVTFARESGLPLAVRGGGHSLAGHSVSNGGITIGLGALRELDLDVAGRTAWAGAGLTAGEYTVAVAEHGLATGFGDTATVGIGGITLAGGIGFLVRRHGLTIDQLLAAEIVTADGQVLMVDDEHHPDLFWAIRGGGGNFGVVTRFRFRLHTLDGVVGGMLLLPASPQLLMDFMALAEDAPDELSVILNVMTAPPMPLIPPEHVGRMVALALVAYAGPTEDGERVLAPFRHLAEPLVDMVQTMPYPGLFPPEEEGEGYHPTAVVRTLFLDRFDGDVAEQVFRHLEASDAPMRAVQLRVLGGAMAQVPPAATAFAHRSSRIMANVAAFYQGPDQKAAREAWVTATAEDLRQEDPGAYVGFLGEDGPARIREAYPGDTFDRLAAIKGRYDPTNLFRGNHNIAPGEG